MIKTATVEAATAETKVVLRFQSAGAGCFAATSSAGWLFCRHQPCDRHRSMPPACAQPTGDYQINAAGRTPQLLRAILVWSSYILLDGSWRFLV
jgi:hypothetical protein